MAALVLALVLAMQSPLNLRSAIGGLMPVYFHLPRFTSLRGNEKAAWAAFAFAIHAWPRVKPLSA